MTLLIRIVIGGLAFALLQEQTVPTFRSTAAAVLVDVSVRDANRRSITGLTARDFELYDNGVLQEVSDVSYGRVPVDATIALDVSHSVTGDLLSRLQRAVVQLVRDLRKEDRLKLILFNMRVTRVVDFTQDEKAVERAIRAATAGGGTALIDAISVALVSATATDRRQLVVFFTDGSDSSSTTVPGAVTEVARRTRATLAFVLPAAASRQTYSPATSGLPAATTTTRIERPVVIPLLDLFNSLAAETGGSVIPTIAGSDLSPTFSRILNEFRSSYVLYFTPRGVDRAGYHALEVKVKRSGAVVNARRGYFAQ